MRNSMKTFWDRVEALRVERGLSKSDLVRKTGLSQTMIQKYMGGSEPRIGTLQKFAKALDVEVGELAPDFAERSASPGSRVVSDARHPSLGELLDELEELGEPLPEDEREFLTSYAMAWKIGDPGKAAYMEQLHRYRIEKKRQARPDARPNLAPPPDPDKLRPLGKPRK